jgi:hypothetical protein
MTTGTTLVASLAASAAGVLIATITCLELKQFYNERGELLTPSSGISQLQPDIASLSVTELVKLVAKRFE